MCTGMHAADLCGSFVCEEVSRRACESSDSIGVAHRVGRVPHELAVRWACALQGWAVGDFYVSKPGWIVYLCYDVHTIMIDSQAR